MIFVLHTCIKVCLHRLCNLFETDSRLKITEIPERLQRLRKSFLISIAKRLHRAPNDRRLFANWSLINP